MLSSTRKHASVHSIIDDSPDQYLTSQGYLFTVIVREDSGNGDVTDMVDFKNEFAAQTYADSINLQNGEDNA